MDSFEDNFEEYGSADEQEEPLLFACRMGHAEEVRRLLDAGADVGEMTEVSGDAGQTPLYAAVWEGHVEIVSMLLEAGAEPTATTPACHDDRTPLHIAAYTGQAKVVRMLLDSGADIAARNCVGYMPLHVAVPLQYREEVVKILLAAGADTEARGDIIRLCH